jgi:TatD DNase family protein
MYIDSHCHLTFPDLAERTGEILQRMREAHVSHALCICTDIDEFPRVRALAEQHAPLFASVGVHPDNEQSRAPTEDELVELASHPRVLAIGETGLDYYRLNGRSIADMAWQRERFRTHIRAARRCGKPLVVHTRSAAADTLALLREEGAAPADGGPGGVLHCFTETAEVAQAALELGFYISFSGIVTFKNAAELRAVAAEVPDERLLIETDSPYLAPVPHRGKVNDPSLVPHVAACLADLRGTTVQQIASRTSANFWRLVGGGSAGDLEKHSLKQDVAASA